MPRTAALAGILFSSLTIGSHLLIRTAVPANPLASTEELLSHANTLLLALNLVPFAGISFLWFMGVFRDHLGEYEDRLFATVFFGSGLLYVAALVFPAWVFVISIWILIQRFRQSSVRSA